MKVLAWSRRGPDYPAQWLAPIPQETPRDARLSFMGFATTLAVSLPNTRVVPKGLPTHVPWGASESQFARHFLQDGLHSKSYEPQNLSRLERPKKCTVIFWQFLSPRRSRRNGFHKLNFNLLRVSYTNTSCLSSVYNISYPLHSRKTLFQAIFTICRCYSELSKGYVFLRNMRNVKGC